MDKLYFKILTAYNITFLIIGGIHLGMIGFNINIF
jgi:hypothetical protein